VRRKAVIIPAIDIENQLTEELRASGATGDFRVSLNSAVESIALPADTPKTFIISDLRYEPHKNYFEATVVAPSRENPIKRMTLAGEVERFVSLPVLKTNMTNGDIISHADIDYIDVSANDLQRDIILDADKIAGMTPRRIAVGGKPLSFNDLQPPQLVGRGETVTLIYKDGGITVSTKGKSGQNATMGELVRVTNLSSNKTVSGVVTGLREITVQ
jgi:flagellar basal body P-ring formation protein FlgA